MESADSTPELEKNIKHTPGLVLSVVLVTQRISSHLVTDLLVMFSW